MLQYMLRDEAFEGDHTEFYQLSNGLHLEYDLKNKKITNFTFEGRVIEDTDEYKLGLQHFHYTNVEIGFGKKLDELEKNGKAKIISSSCRDVLEEYMSSKQHLDVEELNRLIINK